MKPSTQTITGTESSSAMAKAWTCRSAASWLFSAKSWIHPASRSGHRVGVVVPDVDRRADGPVGQGHHDGQPEAGGVVDGLDHEEQSLAGGRGVGARAGGRRARCATDIAANSDSTLMNSHGASRSGLHHLADGLDDVGLGRDRVGAHHLGPAQRDRLGDRPGALNLSQHRSPPRAVAHVVVGRRGGRRVALADRSGEALDAAPGQGLERDLAGQRGEAAEQRGVGQGSPEVLEGQVGRRAGGDPVGRAPGQRGSPSPSSSTVRDVLTRT